MNGIEALAAAETYAASLATEAALLLHRAINAAGRSGELWDAYRLAAGRAADARIVASALAVRLTGTCLSCGVRLYPTTPSAAGNVAACDVHTQTCNRCDADLVGPHSPLRTFFQRATAKGAEATQRATFATYVELWEDEKVILTCGQCRDWVHVLPPPFLLGDAARVAVDHSRKCPGRVD